MTAEAEKRLAALRAVELVEDGMWVGLGTGSTAAHAVRALGERVQAGLRIHGVPTSLATERLARSAGIPIGSFEQRSRLDLAIDGADEVDPELRMIKGGGGALMREKVVAAAAERLVIVTDASKYVPALGRFPLPLEVLPFAWPVVARRIEALGVVPVLRRREGAAVLTDQGNLLLDCAFGAIGDPEALAAELDGIPGLLEHGLFLGLADRVIVARGETIEELRSGVSDI
jgi:ribose 5-phosphate isomerase A